MEMKQARILVKGKVQGVFFRSFAKQHAGKLGLTGYAKNRLDGALEVVVQGDETKINQLAKLCKMGPMMAKVSSVELSWESLSDQFEYFDIRY